MNELLNVAGAPAVGCSALLGIVDWDIIIRSSLLGGAIIAEICAVVVGIGVIAQERREKNQRNGQKNKPLSKSFQFCCRLSRIFCNPNVQSHPSTILPLAGIGGHGVHVEGMNKQLKVSGRSRQNKLANLMLSAWVWPINKCRGFFWCNHTQTPNEKS